MPASRELEARGPPGEWVDGLEVNSPFSFGTARVPSGYRQGSALFTFRLARTVLPETKLAAERPLGRSARRFFFNPQKKKMVEICEWRSCHERTVEPLMVSGSPPVGPGMARVR